MVFYLAPQIISRMRNVKYGNNLLGCGIDLLFCSAAHTKNMLVVIDEMTKVYHPPNTGYDENAAKLLMNNFFNQFSTRERIECKLLRSYIKHKLWS